MINFNEIRTGDMKYYDNLYFTLNINISEVKCRKIPDVDFSFPKRNLINTKKR